MNKELRALVEGDIKHEALGLELPEGATPGLGAWSYGFYEYGMEVPDERVAKGIFAFKQELIYRGFDKGIILDLPEYGKAIRDRVKEFQAATGLAADGRIGPRTARALLWTRCVRSMNAAGVPDRLTARLITLESNDDPVAQGYVDSDDEGLSQIHLPFHLDVSKEEAWDPSFAVGFVTGQLVGAAANCGGDYDGGVASYNCGWFIAKQWVEAGKPASLVINDFDWGARATNYVRLVRKQPIY